MNGTMNGTMNRTMNRTLIITYSLALLIPAGRAWAQWSPKDAPVMTRWADDVTADNVHQEYPRPQMVRQRWLNLNGLWDYALRSRNDDRPAEWEGQILVPFPIESALSGVMERVGPDRCLWYRRTAELPRSWSDKRILLHFGAVDWETTVFVNGRKVGEHRGGYDPFTFDISAALKPAGEQEILIAVWDPTDRGFQPRGKQVGRPRGIWYTPTTGIWQTVWLEPVPQISIERLKMVSDIDAGTLHLTVKSPGADEICSVEALALDNSRVVARATGPVGSALALHIPEAKLWSPDSPFLYDLKVTLLEQGSAIDEVESYFGMRKISLGRDDEGVLRILLNNESLFQLGPLDQGFWPDGLYAAPTDEALRYDIEVTKELGFNMARKHVKIEPDRWYYWCDRLGLLVWQDMPSGDEYIGHDDPDIERTAQSARQFELELKRAIDAFYNHPSIVMWVPFNEGWGQYDTERLASWIKEYDPTRLVNNTSGWADRGVGDVHDIHSYPGPAAPEPEPDRAMVLGEFGGLGYPVAGHLWQSDRNWGYRSYDSPEKLTSAYETLLRRLHRLIGDPGLSAAVYTQTTDIETEINGLMTYDRAVIKMDAERVAAARRRLEMPPPEITTVVPTSQETAFSWRYTMQQPPEDWYRPRFDASSWREGEAGFGKQDTPGAVVRTGWETSDIWIRREFDLPRGSYDNLYLLIHHDEDAEVYINGVLAVRLGGYTSNYVDEAISPEARAALRRRGNVLAIHCHQTRGGQFIDAGFVTIR